MYHAHVCKYENDVGSAATVAVPNSKEQNKQLLLDIQSTREFHIETEYDIMVGDCQIRNGGQRKNAPSPRKLRMKRTVNVSVALKFRVSYSQSNSVAEFLAMRARSALSTASLCSFVCL